jgi:hypothetical protein
LLVTPVIEQHSLQNIENHEQKKKISRRDFLELAGAAAGTVIVTIKSIRRFLETAGVKP